MDERTTLLLGKLPLPQHISVLDAADILGGSHWVASLMREVAEGHLLSWSHSPIRGPAAKTENVTLGTAHALPRITDKTRPASVFVEGKDILWRWCVEHESLIRGVEQPPRETVEAREQLVLRLASTGLNSVGSLTKKPVAFGLAPDPRLAIPESQPLRFDDLANLLANAFWPHRGAGDDRMDYGIARVNLDQELRDAAQNGQLLVRNASTLARETFLMGAALDRCVVLPHELSAYIQERGGVEVRLIPHGRGPSYWTIEHAAAAIADQEQLHAGANDALRARMLEAADLGQLSVRDPHTDLPYRPSKVRDYWEVVTPSDVNAWLHAQGARYRWNTTSELKARDAVTECDAKPRYEDEASRNEHVVGWWNATLNAAMWWALKNVTATEASMLLCGLNPHDAEADGTTLATEGEPKASDYKAMLRWFEDVAGDGAARTLRQWRAIAENRALPRHSWLESWLSSGGGSAAASMPAADALASATRGADQPKGPTVWTDERKAEVRAYRQVHGLKKTAKHFGVSQTVISRYVPATGENKQKKGNPDVWRGLRGS